MLSLDTETSDIPGEMLRNTGSLHFKLKYSNTYNLNDIGKQIS